MSKQQDKKVDQGYRTNCEQNKQVTRIRVLHGLFDCSKINGIRCNKDFPSERCQVITEAFQVRTVRFVACLLVEKTVMTTKKTSFQLIPLKEIRPPRLIIIRCITKYRNSSVKPPRSHLRFLSYQL